MGKSVKLTDGSYIDSAGVWSNTEGKSLDALLAGETYDIDSIITAAGYQSAPSTLTRVGKLVSLCLGIMSTTEVTNTTLFTLPEGYRPKITQPCSLHGYHTTGACAGAIGTDGSVIAFGTLPANAFMGLNITYLAQ